MLLGRTLILLALIGAIGALFLGIRQARRDGEVTEQAGREAEIATAASAALSFLGQTQAPDGSWPAYFSATGAFTQPLPAPRVFTTAFVLRNLMGTAFEESSGYQRGKAFLLAAKEDIAFWAVDGREHELFQSGRLHCKIAPDADTTSWTLLLLAEELRLSPDERREVAARFTRVRNRRGLYGTYLAGYHGAEECPPDYGNRPSLGVNLSILALFRHLGLDGEAAALAVALGREFEHPDFHASAIYYRSRAIMAYFAALAQMPTLTEQILRRPARESPTLEIAGWNNVDLAADLFAKAALCRARNERCMELDPVAEALVARQNDDGSWSPAPLYVAGRLDEAPQSKEFFSGSPAETTALALRALDEFSALRKRP